MQTTNTEQFVRNDLQAHISAGALLQNAANLKALCSPDVKFCAVVKANAYGHGIAEVVDILKQADIDFFAVATIDEALHIAPLIDDRNLLVLEPISSAHRAEKIARCAENSFHCAVTSPAGLQHIARALAETDLCLNLHVNIETGMQRCGIEPSDAPTLIELINRCPNTRLAGIYTHFATADEDDLTFAHQQLERFEDFLARTGLKHNPDIIIHAANSAATIKMPRAHFNMVRCGISLYGYFSRPQTEPPIALTPVLKLQAPIVHIKDIPRAASISYGRSYTTTRRTRAAILPIGYADGYLRCLSNRARVKIAARSAPVIGRVCMDQLITDVTDLPGAKVGDMATLIDDRHDSPCSAYALAQIADTICYEILAHLAPHIRRIVHPPV